MNLEILKKIWKEEEQHSFKGWDFSYINNRTKSDELPWDYKIIVESYMSKEKIMLDMGTGGGEFLLSLNPTSGKTFATESYAPNVELSKKVLPPHGIEVREVVDDEKLPFEDNFFDLIINRHEYYNLQEVKRILKPGGVFITQQVGGMNNKEMSEFLLGENPHIIDLDFNLHRVIQEAREVGFKVSDSGEIYAKSYFYDIGALVFYAKIIEWEFPNFSVERCFNKLLELQDLLEKQGYVESLEHRFYFVAKK